MFKIPMQFVILLTGVMVFVFYLFKQPPLFFNRVHAETGGDERAGREFRELERRVRPRPSKRGAVPRARWRGRRRRQRTAGRAAFERPSREAVMRRERRARARGHWRRSYSER